MHNNDQRHQVKSLRALLTLNWIKPTLRSDNRKQLKYKTFKAKIVLTSPFTHPRTFQRAWDRLVSRLLATRSYFSSTVKPIKLKMFIWLIIYMISWKLSFFSQKKSHSHRQRNRRMMMVSQNWMFQRLIHHSYKILQHQLTSHAKWR